MNTDSVNAAVVALLVADVDVADRDEVAVIVRQASRVQSWLDSVNVRCARRAKELSAEGRSEPAESILGDEGRRSSKEAAGVKARDEICTAMPGFEDALAAGTIGAGHVDAIVNATRNVSDESRDELIALESELLAAAGSERVEMFERTTRDLVRLLTSMSNTGSDSDELDRQRAASKIKRWVDKQTGMHKTLVELDPVRDSVLAAALAAHLRRIRAGEKNSGRSFNSLEVDAFLAAVTAGVTRTGGSGGNVQPGEQLIAVDDPPAELRVPEIGILIDAHTLLNGAHAHGICETYDGVQVPISMVRRLCCDAEIYPVTLDGAGEVVDVGRSKRSVNRAQRRALRAMHRTCAHPGCQVAFDACRIHHIRFWRRDRGTTDIDNLLPVCEQHHHAVHEGRWTLSMTPDRVATWTRPDGVIHHAGSCIDRAPNGVGPPDDAEPDQERAEPTAARAVARRRPGDQAA